VSVDISFMTRVIVGYSTENDGGPSYSGSKAQNRYKTTQNLTGLDFVDNMIESPLDGISKNVTFISESQQSFHHPQL
jgi:hypothetical protein